ncbi:putative ribonuclease H-like domain-containing protein, partial [Tanacetum coccineum]
MVPRTALTRSSPISLNAARQVNTVQPRTSVNNAGPMKNRVNTVNVKNVNVARPNAVVNIARPKAVLSAVKGNKGNVVKASACWVWRPKHKVLDHGNPHQDLKDKGVIDNGCSRHMTGNRSYLIDYEEIDGGFVAFGDSKSSPDAGFKPSGEDEKKDAEDPENKSGCPTEGKDSEASSTEEPIINQEQDDNINSTNNINTASDGNNTNNVNAVSSTVNAVGLEVNDVDPKTSIELPNDPNMLELEDIIYSDDAEDVGAEADMNNLDTFIPRTNHKYFQNCLFACFLSQEEPKKVIQALKDPSWIEAMQEELLQFKLQQVWTLMDLPNVKRAIGYTQEEGIYYDEVFAPVAKFEAIRLFLAYASDKDFVVYQMDVKSAFLYGKIEEEVYAFQPPGFEDPNFPNRVYKVEKALYGLHQAPRAWFETLSTYLLDNRFQRGKIDKTLFIK